MKKNLTIIILLLIFISSCFRSNQEESEKKLLQKEVGNIAIGGVSDLSGTINTSEAQQNF
ncbi:hypothetical protein HGA92_01315 [Candidatus Gracilibacteria bacterium]|nr:hypothetical protein [Candidatus Gracilibacteria bacterium]NUJ98752.1 hypothetical protein [Candidatus Gracilibacteria bacterium]